MPFGRRVKETLSILGPAFLVSVAYLDPGNWATAIEGGSRFGYQLIWVIVVSNLIAILLQTLAARLGIVTGKHLAEVCREQYPPAVCLFLWCLSEISIVALDLTMVLGTAVGINLLFRIPMLPGILLTSLDFMVILFIMPKVARVRLLEFLTICIIGIVFLCFLVDVVLSSPPPSLVLKGLIPTFDRQSIYTAVSLLGANVMPHNFYLHSALVKGRHQGNCSTHALCRLNFIDITLALGVALLINLAVLVVSASAFHSANVSVKTLQEAHDMMEILLSNKIAPAVFGLALLFASQLSTLTGTISGQVVSQGFLNKEISPWLHRLLTRSIAIIPAAALQILYGDEAAYKMLVIAQVVLAIQLPFTLVPLIKSTSQKCLMGSFVNSPVIQVLSWGSTLLIFMANLMLLIQTVLPSESGALEAGLIFHGAWISSRVPVHELIWSLSLITGSCVAIGLLIWMLITPITAKSAGQILPQYILLDQSKEQTTTNHPTTEQDFNSKELSTAEYSKTVLCRLKATPDGRGLGKGARKTLSVILDEFWSQLYDSYGRSCAQMDSKKILFCLDGSLRSIHDLEGAHQLFSPRLDASWKQINQFVVSLLHKALHQEPGEVQYPWKCPRCGTLVIDPSTITSSDSTRDNGVITVFGLWSLENLLNLCCHESRPELWGKYGAVLNRLQWILPRLPCRINNSVISRDHINQLLGILEQELGTRKGQKGSSPASSAYPKGKEIICSILKRYRRALRNDAETMEDPKFVILFPTVLGNTLFTLLAICTEP